MRTIKNILIAIILFINSPVIGQQSISFFTRYGYSGSDHTHAIGIIQQTDGNFKIISKLGRPEWIPYRISEYDQYGNENNNYYYKIKDIYEAIIYKSLMLQNGSILIYGFGDSGNYYAGTPFNILYDSTGSIIWEKTDSLLYYKSIFRQDDSSFTGIGLQHALKNDTVFHYYWSFTKINYNGKVIWNNSPQLYFNSDESLYRNWQSCQVSECNNNNYYYFPSGYTYDSSKFYLPIVISLNNDGQLISKDTIKNIKDITWLKKIIDGYLVISTTSLNQNYTFRVSKLKDNFENQWNFDYPLENSVSADFIDLDKSGNIHLLVTHTEKVSQSTVSYLEIVKLNSEGNRVNKTKLFYIDSMQSENFRVNTVEKILTSDNGYLIAGYIHGQDACDGFLLKLDDSCFVNSKEVIYLSNQTTPTNSFCPSIKPNPFTTYCIIDIPVKISVSKFYLYSVNGELLREEDIHSPKFIFQRENLSGGVYLYKIIGTDKIYSGKLLINP